MPTSSSDILLDRYQLLERLGSGGFSVVDLAWDTRMQRRVAIKRMQLPALYGRHQSLAEEDLPGLAEARAAAMLSNPHIVTMHDFEVSGNEALLIMEHIDGLSLREIMEQSPELLDTDIIAAVVAGVGDALAFAHANQVLHLDIKPDNIMIDQAGVVKVTDFGLAEFVSHASAMGAQGGSIGYMPLEQMAGEAVTEQTDEWALAAVVYETLTGENPFECTTIKESADIIEHGELVVPSAIRPDLSPTIDDIVFQALSVEPFDRYSTIKKFVSPLKKELGNVAQGKKKLRTLIASQGIVDTATLDPVHFDQRGIAYESNGQSYYSGLDEDEPDEETVLFDDDGVRYYRDDDGDPYYLDDEGYPFYYDEDGQPYYFDENGYPYRLDRKGRVRYIEDPNADDTEGDGSAYCPEDNRRKRHRTVKMERAQQRDDEKRKRKIDRQAERDARRRNRRSFAQVTCGCIGERAAAVILRVSAAAAAGYFAYLGSGVFSSGALSAFPLQLTAAGISPVPTALTLSFAAVVGVVAAFVPIVGLAIGLAIACLGLILSGWTIIGCIMLVVSIGWFLTLGRRDAATTDMSLLAPVLGIGALGFLQPLLAGYLLDRRGALIASTTGALMMLVLAPLTGATTLIGPALGIAQTTDAPTLVAGAQLFQTGLSIVPCTDAAHRAFLEYLSDPAPWVCAGAWVLSAVCMSPASKRRGNLSSFLTILFSVVLLALALLAAHALDGVSGIDALFAYALLSPLVIAFMATWLYRPQIGKRKGRARR